MDTVKALISNTGKPIEIIIVDEKNNPIGFRELEENEKLVDVGTYNDHVKPLYDEATNDFIESATPEEIAAARPNLTPKTITEEEKATDLLKIIALNIMNNDELLKTFGIEPRPTA